MIPNGPAPVLYQFQPYPPPSPPPDLTAALHKALAVAAYMHGQGQAAAERPVLTPLHMADDRIPSPLPGHAPIFTQPVMYESAPTRRGPQ